MRPNFSLGLSRLSLLALAGLAAACSSLSDEQRYAVARDWERISTLDIFPISDDQQDALDGALPLPSTREDLAERRICLHKNGENRVILQDGVSDRVDYRRCALAPYPETPPLGDAPGQRMENRPADLAPGKRRFVPSIPVINGAE